MFKQMSKMPSLYSKQHYKLWSLIKRFQEGTNDEHNFPPLSLWNADKLFCPINFIILN